MTTTEPAPTSIPVSGLLDKNLTEACRDTKAKIARVDIKTSFLLAFDGAILAGIDEPLPSRQPEDGPRPRSSGGQQNIASQDPPQERHARRPAAGPHAQRGVRHR
ncbi:hypothetical protein ACFUIZ_32470 [Streptomyces cinereoruber]|uniref:hypothetical protein n=1 Tax=Streptomyces cinereoruber TaxID=67260 RepID=UPI00362AC048